MILTNNILLIEPVGFGFNPETAADNKFQIEKKTGDIQKQFNEFKTVLENAGLNVHLLCPGDTTTPDALYPNNWFSTFPDKSLIIYPMMAINRRSEKRTHFIHYLKQFYSKITDLSFLENSDSFLEGTGSLVIDHTHKTAYACLSQRTSTAAIEEWKSESGYKVVQFSATDVNGFPVYHTNVILTLAADFAIVCLESIIPEDRNQVQEQLLSTGKEIVEISFEQTKSFCGNCLALKNKNGEQIIVMSDVARNAFTNDQIKRIKTTATIVSSDISEIEQIGGGGARCMIAELF